MDTWGTIQDLPLIAYSYLDRLPLLRLLAEEGIDLAIGEVDEDLFGEQRVAEALLVGVADIAIDRAIRIFEGIEYAGGIGFRGVKERGDEVIATVIALLLFRRAAGYTQECKKPKQGSRNLIHAAKLRKTHGSLVAPSYRRLSIARRGSLLSTARGGFIAVELSYQ